jgi:hypothetical protein
LYIIGPACLSGAVGHSRDGDHLALSNKTEKETHMPNPKLKRKGLRIQFLGLFILLADAVFGFFLFRGDLGDRYLESVYFPILMTAVIAFATCMVWGGSVIKRARFEYDPVA